MIERTTEDTLRFERDMLRIQRDELLAALKSAHAELIDIKADVELAKSMKLSQTAFEAAEKLDEAQLLIPFSRERTFEQTKEAAGQIIKAAIDAAYEKGRQDEYDEWVGPRKSSPVTEKQVAPELLLIPTAQEKLSDGKLRAPVEGNVNYPEDAPRHTLD